MTILYATVFILLLHAEGRLGRIYFYGSKASAGSPQRGYEAPRSLTNPEKKRYARARCEALMT